MWQQIVYESYLAYNIFIIVSKWGQTEACIIKCIFSNNTIVLIYLFTLKIKFHLITRYFYLNFAKRSNKKVLNCSCIVWTSAMVPKMIYSLLIHMKQNAGNVLWNLMTQWYYKTNSRNYFTEYIYIMEVLITIFFIFKRCATILYFEERLISDKWILGTQVPFFSGVKIPQIWK